MPTSNARPLPPSGNDEPIGNLPEGAVARVARLSLNPRMTRRLLALGLRPGTLVRVCQRRGHGCVVAVGSTRVAIGTELAGRLRVVRESEDSLVPESLESV
jgi:ferrous iron transport protein A